MGPMTSGSMLKFWHILVLHNLDLLRCFFLICVFNGFFGMGNHHGSITFWDEIVCFDARIAFHNFFWDLRKTPEIFSCLAILCDLFGMVKT